ncbi:hypothetical protein [Azomonas macrocytogenes]|uniref:Virion structural protein n=1 Tax=Azomonas macrocytogenes TaxID=69962 RepID=A0A839T3X8_AZOMA|nr:hypothetical protein [Azomonas macrocytogenes]MBB3103798.1 hypothetical protein [Azomonas macrocytogenes]
MAIAQRETFSFSQGNVLAALIDATGITGPYFELFDVSVLTGAIAEERVQHRESYSGKRSLAVDFGISQDMTWNATLHSINTRNLALFTNGTSSDVEGGTVTGEVLPTELVAGDIIALDNPNVSGLTITDSAGTPIALAPENYELNAVHGSVKILSIPTSPAPIQPFKAAYSFTEYSQTAFLNAGQKQMALRYEGINLADNSNGVILDLYRVSAGLLTELALIADGTDVLGMPVTFTSLLDTRKPASGSLGRFGRLIQTGTAAI